MASKLQNWIQKTSNKIIVGGAVIGVIGLAGGLVYLFNKGSTPSTHQEASSSLAKAAAPSRSKEEFLKMVKYLKRETYPLLYNTSLMAMNVHTQYRGAIPTEELKKLLITESKTSWWLA